MSPWLPLLALGYWKLMLAAALPWGPKAVTPAWSAAPGEALFAGTASPFAVATVHQPGSPELSVYFPSSLALARSHSLLAHIWGDTVLTAENSSSVLVFPFAGELEKGQRYSEHKRNPDLFAMQKCLLEHRGKAIAASQLLFPHLYKTEEGKLLNVSFFVLVFFSWKNHPRICTCCTWHIFDTYRDLPLWQQCKGVGVSSGTRMKKILSPESPPATYSTVTDVYDMT